MRVGQPAVLVTSKAHLHNDDAIHSFGHSLMLKVKKTEQERERERERKRIFMYTWESARIYTRAISAGKKMMRLSDDNSSREM
jgi:hypothetical protein